MVWLQEHAGQQALGGRLVTGGLLVKGWMMTEPTAPFKLIWVHICPEERLASELREGALWVCPSTHLVTGGCWVLVTFSLTSLSCRFLPLPVVLLAQMSLRR